MCYPKIQEKMAEEIVVGVGKDGKVTLEHKASLQYVRAVILELLRYTTVVPLGITHRTVKDTELCGVAVPNGTNVGGRHRQMYCLHVAAITELRDHEGKAMQTLRT